tara:strand:- start:815 stop:1012 length:198 start_codon:yes stop_codon:yes gene_type:complete
MVKSLGWLGSIAMCISPFVIDTVEGKILAIVGLGLLTVQASKAKLWNFVLLNIAGIGGYFYALYF